MNRASLLFVLALLAVPAGAPLAQTAPAGSTPAAQPEPERLPTAPDEVEDPVLLDVMAQWATKAKDELSLADAPAPHRVTIAAWDRRKADVEAYFGELVSADVRPERPAVVEVVVGDDTLDSARFQGGLRSFGGTSNKQRLNLVVQDVPIAFERDFWMATDAAYRAAVSVLEQKQTVLAQRAGEPPPPDWSPARPHRTVVPGLDRVPDRRRLEQLTVAASGAVRDAGLDGAQARAHAEDGDALLATTEGQQLVQPQGYAALHLSMWVRLPDGSKLEDELVWVARTEHQLPTAEAVAAQARAAGLHLAARARAEAVDYYEGPAVFEGQAASALLAALVPPELEGTPPAPSAVTNWKMQLRKEPRIGRKLLPDGWSVVDDPSAARAGEAGGYWFDVEGVRGERVVAVQDGWVRDLLMTRIPRKDAPASNGHARGDQYGDWEARTTVWTASPGTLLDDAAFDAEVAQAVQSSQVERLLVVRRVAPGRRGQLGAVVEAVWRDAAGVETPVRALELQGVTRRLLKDIAAAGGTLQRVPYLASSGNTRPTMRGLPMVATTPSRLLLEAVEAVDPGPSGKPPTYPRPEQR